MKFDTSRDIVKFMRSYVESAALGAALELGLFWILDKHPLPTAAIARTLDIPLFRCRYWLELLSDLGLLERDLDGYKLTNTTHDTILGSFSQETWALLAVEARERLPSVIDLALHLREPGSVWTAQGLESPSYVDQMEHDLERARRFTRMLLELHQPLAEELVQTLNMEGVMRLLDLGGGSGVISLALLDRHPDLNAVVVDIANVCAAGRKIAEEYLMEARLAFHVADLLEDELPTGFDFVLECDVGIYEVRLFRKAYASLSDGGRIALVDHFAPAEGIAPAPHLVHSFQASLANPEFTYPTVSEVEATLKLASFEVLTVQRLSNGMDLIIAEKN